MRIETTGKALGLTALVGANVTREDWTEKKEFNSEAMKLSPEGKVMFTTRKAMLWMDQEGNAMELNISVTEPVEVPAFSRVQLGGKVWVTHWIKGGNGERAQMAVSIVAERLEPVKGEASV